MTDGWWRRPASLLARGAAVALLVLAPGGSGPTGLAQPRHPIYAQYDGFTRTDDDRLVLAFGYHNLNQVEVAVDAGDGNRFLPGPSDRRQPTVFETGRHRFACVMVVAEPFDGTLQWQVTFAGRTSTTTARVLDPLYALEAGSARQVLETLGTRRGPAGRCLLADAG